MPRRGNFHAGKCDIVPRWLWFAPFACLVVAVGLLAYRQGLKLSRITENDVIETYTAYYVRTYGEPARATDCTARPGPGNAIWIVVSCVAPRGEHIDYPVDRFGRLMKLETAPEAVDVPQT